MTAPRQPLPFLATLVFVAIAFALAACDRTANSSNLSGASNQRTILATTGMIADVTRRLTAGIEGIRVEGLIGEGVDPHLYQPTRDDVATLLQSDVVLYNGLLLEGKMSDALIRVARTGKPVYAVTEELDRSYIMTPEGFDGHDDPHVWMDPKAWSAATRVIAERLSMALPDLAEDINANLATYEDKLTELDAYCDRVLATVPESSRVLVTAHDAFGYFGRRFGFEVVGIQGLSTESEAGVRDIERIVDLLIERKINAVFVESTVSERNVQAIVDGARAGGHTVTIGGELFSDAMGAAGTYEGTYIGMIDHNVTTIANALGGEAPADGMLGRLSASDGASKGP